MNFNISEIQLYKLLFYIVFGAILFIVLYIINHYVIPLIKRKQHHINKYWQKLQIIAWLLFLGMFFIALIRTNMLITLIFLMIILGLGWNFWSNIFSGIIIRFNNQFEPGEVISTEFAKGELKSINLSQSELINDKGETIIIPNKKLRSAILTHYHKKSNVQMHSFKATFPGKTLEAVYQLALNCPYISSNQKIEVERTNNDEFTINAAIIDNSFVDKVNQYLLLKI